VRIIFVHWTNNTVGSVELLAELLPKNCIVRCIDVCTVVLCGVYYVQE